jgi:hypothetical protein
MSQRGQQLPTRIVRGDIVWTFDPFHALLQAFRDEEEFSIDTGDPTEVDERPFLVVNKQNHPFDQEEFIAMLVTTKRRSQALELRAEDFERGGMPQQSFLSPWVVGTIKKEFLTGFQGTIEASRVDDAVREVNRYIS